MAASKDVLDAELGLDEAGRGPMLGPMVMAVVALSPQAALALRELGVTDSKRFGAGEKAHYKRHGLIAEITSRACHVEVAVVAVAEIDEHVRAGRLNHLERRVAEELLSRAPRCARIFADGKRLFEPLARRIPGLCAEDKADSRFVSVAAASLCAKVRRDELWLQICERYRPEFPGLLDGMAGGGYVNEATRRFLRAYAARHHRLPEETRLSWPREFLQGLLPEEAPLAKGPLLLPWGN
jgi:ribonuclease HII